MERVEYNTGLFKNVFNNDYDTFSNWYKTCGLSENGAEWPSKITFTLISNEFDDSHIAFSVESFKAHFANDLYTFYQEFEATTKAIKELMQLTDADITLDASTILNMAEVPETASSTDSVAIDFISTQQKTINKKGTLQIKREQLTNKRALTVKTFLNRFRHLFIKIISPAYTFVVAEPNDEE